MMSNGICKSFLLDRIKEITMLIGFISSPIERRVQVEGELRSTIEWISSLPGESAKEA
jgi:hypothetical protein